MESGKSRKFNPEKSKNLKKIDSKKNRNQKKLEF